MTIDTFKLTTELIENNIIKFGSFTLKSGAKSWFYVDLRLIPSFPSLFRLVIDAYIDKLSHLSSVEAVAGIAVAGIPFSSAIGYRAEIPSLIVRKESKEYGLKKMVEGKLKEGATVVLIDDVITTGGSKIPAIRALRENGYKVNDLLVLIDRSKGQNNELQEIDVTLNSVMTIEEIFRSALKVDEKIVPTEIKEKIEQFLND